ncbi:class I SAM-dependent methyltransferase [Candidatus Woesearchaeota archaeon]|nr:class I SAM-dependent methyltransferase [Candidatus Woesearchaeota archaeon]
MPELEENFNRIKHAYAELERELRDSGKGLVYRTEKGIYGTTNLDNIFRFFKEINLQNYRHFLDLGCGDCRVVLVAALFTKAAGIEFDSELVAHGQKIRDNLGISCELITGDYLEHDLGKYDIIFMNPDHEFGELDAKLKAELNGPLFVHNEIFAPAMLVKGKKYWAGQIPIVKYTKE